MTNRSPVPRPFPTVPKRTGSSPFPRSPLYRNGNGEHPRGAETQGKSVPNHTAAVAVVRHILGGVAIEETKT
jgi:hypothetical protein